MKIQSPQVHLARPEWNHEDYFREKFKDVTILICQRKTRDLIQLCLSSILNHYPEINVLVVDGHSEDDSVEWLRFMSAKHPNVKLWERPEGRNSHGETMDEAIKQFITTKYVLLMDSDTIVRRGGFVEGMLEQFAWEKLEGNKILYAVGSLMLQSIKGEACSQPENEDDVLRYAHPSCSMYDVEIYKTLQPFTDHGAPCALNNIDAQSKGYGVEYFPVDKYVQHLCGASWQEVCTVWNDDGDVIVRPLVTFITWSVGNVLANDFINIQEPDYNIVPKGKRIERKVSTYDRGVIQSNPLYYDIRLKVTGHYVCEVDNETVLRTDFISELRKMCTEIMGNEIKHAGLVEFEFEGLKLYERKHWQKYHSIK